MLVLGLGLGFRVQRCMDPEILGPHSDHASASAAIRNSVSAVSPRMHCKLCQPSILLIIPIIPYDS